MIRILSFAVFLVSVSAVAQTAVRVKMFPGAQALPVIAAATQGIFER